MLSGKLFEETAMHNYMNILYDFVCHQTLFEDSY